MKKYYEKSSRGYLTEFKENFTRRTGEVPKKNLKQVEIFFNHVPIRKSAFFKRTFPKVLNIYFLGIFRKYVSIFLLL